MGRWDGKGGLAHCEGIRQEHRRSEVSAARSARTCARLRHASGGELEQIQFLLGHVSVQTTERHLGCKQRIRSAVNDRIGVEPNP
jgi:integrase